MDETDPLYLAPLWLKIALAVLAAGTVIYSLI